jgi:hypothetical protein
MEVLLLLATWLLHSIVCGFAHQTDEEWNQAAKKIEAAKKVEMRHRHGADSPACKM